LETIFFSTNRINNSEVKGYSSGEVKQFYYKFDVILNVHLR